jgi:superfamily II DNA or RNA helicase
MDVINSFNSRYRIGFSGTTETKSESHKITNFILGPVIIRAKSNKVPCKVIVVKTRISIPLAGEGDPRFFGQMLTYLANNDKRNTLIANYLKAYADAGHYCISVSDRVKMIESVTKKLVEAGVKAESYHGTRFKTDKAREDCLQRARNKSIPVLNAQRRMTLGLDIPPLTAFFNLLPSANKQNYLQETSRVRTPFPDKTMAYIVDFVDEHPIAYACFNARKKVYQQEGFEITGGM